MLVSYTNAKLMSNTDTLTSWLEGGTTGGVGGIQDWNNLKGERSLSSQDVPQRLVASYVLDLPFGHGKKFVSGLNGFGNAVVSGWGLDGITTLQRGFPVKISWGGGDALTSAGLGIGSLRPDYIPGCDKNVSGSAVARVNGVVQHGLLYCTQRKQRLRAVHRTIPGPLVTNLASMPRSGSKASSISTSPCSSGPRSWKD